MAGRILKKTGKYLVYILLIPVCLEIAFLILGYRAYSYEKFDVEATPENAFVGHPEYGIALSEGSYQVKLNDKVEFRATHVNPIQRLIPSQPDSADRSLVFLGCSFTYGYGVNDDETFSAILQRQFPEIKVENYAVPGHGTVQNLMITDSILSNTNIPPDLVCVVLSSEHFMRNVMSPMYRSHLNIGYKNSNHQIESSMRSARFPYIESIRTGIQYAKWENLYRNLPGRESFAAINWFQTLQDNRSQSTFNEIRVTGWLLNQIDQKCSTRGTRMLVVCLDNSWSTQWLKTYCDDLDWVDINFDFTDRHYTHLPFDHHPSQSGHQLIADKLAPFLTSTDQID